MRKPPTQKQIAVTAGVKQKTADKYFSGETASNPALSFETAKQCGKTSLENINCIMQDMLDGLHDNTVIAFALVHKVSQQDARQLLGFLSALQESKVQISHVAIACTRRLGVHAIIDCAGLYIQAVANGLDLTIHIGHLPFAGSIEECITILTALNRGINE